MPVPDIALTTFSGPSDKPLLVLGPSLGTSVSALWQHTARLLGDRFDVIGWDLPGHGSSAPAVENFSIEELAVGVNSAVLRFQAKGADSGLCFYAGVSVGGAVGLQLLLDFPEFVDAAVVLCTGAKIGETEGWHDRASTVRKAGTGSMVEGSIERWFAPGFADRSAAQANPVLRSLRDAHDESYAQVCEALGGFDVRSRLGNIATPVHAVAGRHDAVTTIDSLTEIANGVRDGTLTVLDDVAHLAPLEDPSAVAHIVGTHCSNTMVDKKAQQ